MDQKQATDELAQVEQSLEQFSLQKKQFQSQLMETSATLHALEGSGDAYKLIGNVMVKQSQEDLKKELSEKKSLLDVRLSTIEKQEDKLRAKVKELQEVILQK